MDEKDKIRAKIESLWLPQGHMNIDQRNFFINLLYGKRIGYCLETGFAGGRSTITTMETCKPIKMISIDINLDYMEGRTQSVFLQRLYPTLSIIEGDSNKVLTDDFFLKEFKYGIDFAYVDGGHEYKECMFDLESILPRLNFGGLIVVDDYMSGPPNGWKDDRVTKAVDDFHLKYFNILHKMVWYKLGKGCAIFLKD